MFKFLEYVNPVWYYNVFISYNNVLPKFENLNEDDKKLFDLSFPYQSEDAINFDLAYQLIQKGFIELKSNLIYSNHKKINQNTLDNYLFIKRYFGLSKLIYVFLVRIFTFHNPISEIIYFIKSIRTNTINIFNKTKNYNYRVFESEFILSKPLVSVVIPTLNRYKYLKDVLVDLENQSYKNFEVLICDQSDEFNQDFYKGWNLNIKVFSQKEKALWLARNKCILSSKGEYILLFDDDSRVKPDWIFQHLKCIDFFNAEISAGVTDTIVGHGKSRKDIYFHLSDVFDTGNALVHKKVFKKIGLFDRQFEKQRMGDGEFGLRSLLGGYPSISNPYASRVHLKVDSGGLRQMGSWDAFRSKNIFSPRPIPSVMYFLRKYFGNKIILYYLIQNIPFSYIPYEHKNSKSFKFLALFFFPLFIPLFFLVVYKSWYLSSRKLNEGAMIDSLA